jgi:flagellar protein FlaI
MQRLEIASSTNIQNQDGKRHPGPYYRISIYGKENLLQFKAKIGFKHDKKAKALEILIDKSANSIDEFPKIEKIIREARIENKLTQTELCALMGTTTRSVIAAYERNAKNVTRKQLKKIANCLTGETAKQLKIFAESNILFEKVTEAKETEYNGFIYDMTVEDNHNYLANGIIISNCLGTVHANSPEETIVRVTSPPMNVPSIMLSGLDLIIVEHRYYDRKKGTIRRVSEIAEIYNALEGQPKTQTIFQRDPAKDALERTLIESKYLKVLQTFTGVSKDRIQAELKTRKLFLDNLVNKNIRSLSEVSSKSKQYIEAKKGIGENK